jgi:hypothetical protein
MAVKAAAKQPDLWRHRYGVKWPPLCDIKGKPLGPRPDFRIELEVLRDYDKLTEQGARLGTWEQHFRLFVRSLWGRPDSVRKFLWNPYADKMINRAIQHKFLAVAGHASSGKTEAFAIWALAKFLIGAPGPNGEPYDSRYVKVFVTSTTLAESRQRVWGVIENYWQDLAKLFGGEQYLPGKLVSSQGKIVYRDGNTFSDLAGIALIAGGKGQDKDASTKIGFKARNVILIADELPLLTPQLYATAKGNLFSNDNFQMIGIGNPTSAFDPFGEFAEPKDGWGSITEDYDEWETKLGWCVRFDGLKSPNVLAAREVYPGLLTLDKVEAYINMLGRQSPEFYRMVRGFLCPTGVANQVFSEQEIIGSLAMNRVTTWEEPPELLAFLDPSWTAGGDRAPVTFGRCGVAVDPLTRERKKVVERTETIDLMKRVNAKHESKEVAEQIAEMFIEECKKRNVPVSNMGLDATGGGTPLAAILTMKIGRGFQLVSFAGGASDRRISPVDKRLAKDLYTNKVTELWNVCKELNKNRQIKGLDHDTVLELCGRLYEVTGNGKQCVESKTDMKKRTNGKSPDLADSFVGLVDIARTRCGLSAASKAPPRGSAPVLGGNRRLASVMDSSWGQKRTPSLADEAVPTLGGGGWGD